jgi:hypothetical protein
MIQSQAGVAGRNAARSPVQDAHPTPHGALGRTNPPPLMRLDRCPLAGTCPGRSRGNGYPDHLIRSHPGRTDVLALVRVLPPGVQLGDVAAISRRPYIGPNEPTRYPARRSQSYGVAARGRRPPRYV